MNRPFVLVIAAVGFCLLGVVFSAAAAKEGGTEVLPTASVTSEILESKIAEVEAATDLTDQAKTKLVELYRKALNELINRKRQLEAEEAIRAAEKARRETEGLDPLLIQLSEENTALTEEVNKMAEHLQALDREQEQAVKLAKRIAADYKDARATLASSGLTEGLGPVLLEQRESLPDLQAYRLLVWLRSVDPIRFEDLLDLPEELQQLLSAAVWLDLGDTFIDQVVHGIAFWLVLLVTAVLMWKRRALIAAIQETAKRVGKPTTDSFAATLRASVLTLLAAAPLPLLLAVVGWQLQTTAQGTGLYLAIGDTLSRIALHVYILQLLYTICAPGGLAAIHFRWPKSNLQLLRVEVNRLIWIFVPTVLLTRLAIDLNPTETGNTITRLSLTLGFVALTFFLYRVFHPNRGVLAYLRPRHKRGLIFRTYPLWFSLLLLYAPGLAVLTLSGYVYSAFALGLMLVHTLWLILALVVVNALALRWLRLLRRRLAYEEALEQRVAALAPKQAGEPVIGGEDGGASQFEEPEVDLEELSEDSRELVKLTVVFTGLVSLYLIWSSLLPALRIFEDVSLWYHTATVEGEDKRLPITLADLGLAIIYAIAIGILAKRLPALLEIILLRRFDLSSGSRYTVTTLTNYTIVAIGVILVLNTIGAQWSQLQWLVAALGVGIGFGLQEIVANFISGLIILLERPIRVGDFVTVGDTDGAVSKIRIRATTIRNLDGKELLVPNKEFITGRLLNWSLSDQTTRIIISVGIAYGSDVRQALNLLEEAAVENETVLDDPAPSVIFEGFGDNALTMLLRCFVESVDLRFPTISALNGAINDKFNAAGIVIAFPQRDLHLDTRGPLRVSIEDTSQNAHPVL